MGESGGAHKPAKVKDVAKAAGVSVATVSRAFNPLAQVSEEARQRVLEVAKQLGYSPNPAAKALRMQRTFIVGAVFPAVDYGFYARLLNSFQQRMNDAGYLCVMLTAGFDNSKIFNSVRQLLDRGVEALMVVGRIDDPRLIAHLLERRIPVVTTFSTLIDAPFSSVGIDNYAATTRVMRHLLELGHREFAMISGPAAGNDRQQARQRAFCDALTAAGITSEPLILERTQGYLIKYGVDAFQTIRENHPRVTAVVCNSDAYGMAVLLESSRHGVSVPSDLSVVGFDDQEFAALLNPPMTTVSFSVEEMGTRAADSLLRKLSGEVSSDFTEHVALETSLAVRGSTAPPPKR